MTLEQTAAARARGAARAEQLGAARAALRREAEGFRDTRPVAPLYLMEALGRVLPADVAVVEEAPTTTMGCYFERAGLLGNTSGYFAQRGWALGWGLNCAIGVQLAWPDRPVLALVGNGSAMYGIQGLWTAARYRIPVTFVLCNNAEYRILKDCAGVLKLPAAQAGWYEGLDLVGPEIDFVALARSLGVASERIDEPGALGPAVRDALDGDEPRLIEVRVAR
jgi:benzoylformate decarboxylase